MKKKSIASTVCALACWSAMLIVQAAKAQSAGDAHQLVRAGELKWEPSFMGCEHANISGNPSAEGKPFVLRIRCPDGAKVPPHWHPTDENITALEGNFMIGTGDVFDSSKVTPMDFQCAFGNGKRLLDSSTKGIGHLEKTTFSYPGERPSAPILDAIRDRGFMGIHAEIRAGELRGTPSDEGHLLPNPDPPELRLAR